jgi:hypothetical protein
VLIDGFGRRTRSFSEGTYRSPFCCKNVVKIQASVAAAGRAKKFLKVYAVEKNKNAVVTLQHLVRKHNWDNVQIISGDMRTWNSPEKVQMPFLLVS